MVLAELLNERKAHAQKISELTAQIGGGAIVDVDESAIEEKSIEVKDSLKELEITLIRWHEVNIAIKNANNRAKLGFEQDLTVADAILYRDFLNKKYEAYSGILRVLESDSRRSNRYGIARRSKDEVAVRALLKTSEYRGLVNQIAQEIRELDIAIQKVNWSFEV